MAEKLTDTTDDMQIMNSVLSNLVKYANSEKDRKQKQVIIDKAAQSEIKADIEATNDEVDTFYSTFLSEVKSGNLDTAEASLNFFRRKEYDGAQLPESLPNMERKIESLKKIDSQFKYHFTNMLQGNSVEDINSSHSYFEANSQNFSHSQNVKLNNFYRSTAYVANADGRYSNIKSTRENQDAYNSNLFLNPVSSPEALLASNPDMYESHMKPIRNMMGENKTDPKTGELVLDDDDMLIKYTEADYRLKLAQDTLPILLMQQYKQFQDRGFTFEKAFDGLPKGSSYAKTQLINQATLVAGSLVVGENPKLTGEQTKELTDIKLGNLLGENYKNDRDEKDAYNLVINKSKDEITNQIASLQKQLTDAKDMKVFHFGQRVSAGQKDKSIAAKKEKEKNIADIEAKIKKLKKELHSKISVK